MLKENECRATAAAIHYSYSFTTAGLLLQMYRSIESIDVSLLGTTDFVLGSIDRLNS